MTSLSKARTLALLIPALLMAGALGSQYLGGLFPCHMCHWQRWPHYGAIILVLLAFAPKERRTITVLVALAAICVLISGLIGIYHAGAEYKWWEGVTDCLTTASEPLTIDNIGKVPIIRCDEPQWTLFGISLAGFNAIFSILGALAVFALLRRRDAQV